MSAGEVDAYCGWDAGAWVISAIIPRTRGTPRRRGLTPRCDAHTVVVSDTATNGSLMAIKVQSDELAAKVTAGTELFSDPVRARPVVLLCGWLEVNGASTRLFTDAGFGEWFEIPAEKIIHQIPGSDRPHDEGRSCIWVLADTPVTKCEAGTAGRFANTEPEDPAGNNPLPFRKIWPW